MLYRKGKKISINNHMHTMNLTRISFFLVLIAIVFSACKSEQEVQFEELKKQYDEAYASLKYYRSSFDQTKEEYTALREQYDSQPNKVGTDSLHTLLRGNHDKLLEKHEAFFRQEREVLQKHEDMQERLKVDGYPIENRIADVEEMIGEIKKLTNEYEYINQEHNVMIEEQRGMLQTINTPNLPTRPIERQ
jgi:DNA repair exonuclease SbcCD ATPase subunit